MLVAVLWATALTVAAPLARPWRAALLGKRRPRSARSLYMGHMYPTFSAESRDVYPVHGL